MEENVTIEEENNTTTQLVPKLTGELADRIVEVEKKKELKRFYDKKTFFEWLVKVYAKQEKIK